MLGKNRVFSALILDCDGVIVDSEPYSCRAWNVAFQDEFGIKDIGSDYDSILGKNTYDAAIFYLRRFGLDASDATVERLMLLKENAYFDLARNNLTAIEGVEKVIEQAHRIGWKAAVASSGTREKVTFNLDQVNLGDSFDVIACSRKGMRGKPYPDIFLDAAEKLREPVRQCVVIEDTPNGIRAAKHAEMYVIAIATTFAASQLTEADMIISDFQELDLSKLE